MYSAAPIVMAVMLAGLAPAPAWAQIVEGADVPCPVTVQNRPPANAQSPGTRIHGTDALSVELTRGSTHLFDPAVSGSVLPDGALKVKYSMYRGVRGQISIRGRRLDARAAPLKSEVNEHYGPIGLQPVSLFFPTPGCWEVTASIRDVSLAFVVRVVRIHRSELP